MGQARAAVPPSSPLPCRRRVFRYSCNSRPITLSQSTRSAINRHKGPRSAAKQFVSINLGLFLKEVNDRRATPAKRKEYIEKAVKDYAFHLETMQTAKDQAHSPMTRR